MVWRAGAVVGTNFSSSEMAVFMTFAQLFLAQLQYFTSEIRLYPLLLYRQATLFSLSLQYCTIV